MAMDALYECSDDQWNKRTVLMSLMVVYQLFNKQHEENILCAILSLKALIITQCRKKFH